MQLSRDKMQMCSIQGRLFEMSAHRGIRSEAFVCAFMRSDAAARIDLPYDRLQWAGEEYIFAELSDELGERMPEGDTWPSDVLYWMGYLYRYWHYLTGEASAEIAEIAPPATMALCWPGYPTLDPKMAVERLKEAAAMASRG